MPSSFSPVSSRDPLWRYEDCCHVYVLPTGLAGAHDVEYIPYHLCSSKTVVHKIYHNEKHPSYLLLPIIPADAQRWIS